jgi:hypothetical protein
MSPHKTFLLSLTMLAAIISASAALAGGGVPIPSDYIGIWEYNSITRDCTTQSIINQTAGRDTVCAGDIFDPSQGQYLLDCTGTADGNTIDLHCTGSFQKDPKCLVNVEYDVDGTRNGDSWTTTTTLNFQFVGATCPIAEFCTVTTSTSTRVDPDPNCTQAPVDPASWGRIKHQYMD